MNKVVAILLFFALLGGSALSAQDTPKPDPRTWKDSTEQFSIEAVFVKLSGDLVVLQPTGQKEISIPLAKLSKADRQYVLIEVNRRFVSVTPSQDLAAIVQRAAPNTTIVLEPGIYKLGPRPPYEQAVLIEKKRNLILTSRDAAKTQIELSADTKFGFYIGSNNSDLKIQNLTIRGTPSAEPNTTAVGNYSGTTNVRRVQFSGLRVEQVTVGISVATDLTGVYQDVVVRDNIVSRTIGTEAGSGYGIHLSNGKNVTVSNNVIEAATRHSIYVARSALGSNVRVEKNLIINHDLKGKNPRWYNAALVCARSSDVTISHNLIVDPRAIAISVERDGILGRPTRDNKVINNRVIGANYVGIWVVTGKPCLGLGNIIALNPKPAHPDWCCKVSFFDYPNGKPTSSSLVEPQARWKQATHVVELGGRLFVMTDGVLDMVTPGSWAYDTCPRRWDDVRGMVGLKNRSGKNKGRLYIVTGTGLHEVNPAGWDIRSSQGNWADATFVTTTAGYIHVLQGDVLHRLSPLSPDSEPKTAQWAGARWMFSMGSYLYLACNRGRFRLDPATLEGVQVGVTEPETPDPTPPDDE
ncbi:MAG: SHD1 domain-containing protein [Pirellulaceae bacterium]